MSKAFMRKWKTPVAWTLAILLVYYLRGILIHAAIVAAGALVFCAVMSPLCRRLEGLGISVAAASLISISCLLGVLLIVLGVLLPSLISKSAELIVRLTPTLTEIVMHIQDVLGSTGFSFQEGAGVPDWILSGFTIVSSMLARAGIWAIRQTGQVVLALVIAFYLLRERRRFACDLLLILPVGRRSDVCSALLGCKNAVYSYLSGVVKTSLFVMLLMFVGLMLLRIQDAFLLSLLMGVLEVFPYIGPVLGSFPIVLAAIPRGTECVISCLLLIIVVQQIEGNVAGPMFTSSSTSLHPLASIIGVYIGGSLFGLWGILFSVPLMVILRNAVWTLQAVREG